MAGSVVVSALLDGLNLTKLVVDSDLAFFENLLGHLLVLANHESESLGFADLVSWEVDSINFAPFGKDFSDFGFGSISGKNPDRSEAFANARLWVKLVSDDLNFDLDSVNSLGCASLDGLLGSVD